MGEDPITDQGSLDGINRHQNPRGKSKVNISLCIRNRYQIIDIEYICSIFDQVRPVVSYIEFNLSRKSPTPKNIGEGLSSSEKILERRFICAI